MAAAALGGLVWIGCQSVPPVGSPGSPENSSQALMARIRRACARAAAFLEQAQRADGRFEMYYWHPQRPELSGAIHSHFQGFFIVEALAALEDEGRKQRVVTRMYESLKSEVTSEGLLRYAPMGDSYYEQFSVAYLPADADDTSLFLGFLADNGLSIPQSAPRKIEEVQRGDGAVPLWLEPLDPALNQLELLTGIDLASQALVLHGLYRIGRENPMLCKYIIDSLSRERLMAGELYYRDGYVTSYFLSRAYRFGPARCLEAVKPVVVDYLSDVSDSSSLRVALNYLTIFNFTEKETLLFEKNIAGLLSAQRRDGSWVREPVLSGPNGEYYGGEDLSTAFIMQALGTWMRNKR